MVLWVSVGDEPGSGLDSGRQVNSSPGRSPALGAVSRRSRGTGLLMKLGAGADCAVTVAPVTTATLVNAITDDLTSFLIAAPVPLHLAERDPSR